MNDRLNPQQTAVVDWIVNGTGSLNLIARAGCGKTYTLIEGAVRAIVEHDLGDVALMAYNKSAGEEFKARLARMNDPRFLDWKKVQAGTVHSFGFGAVRKWAPKVKGDGKKVYDILSALADGDEHSVYAREAGSIN